MSGAEVIGVISGIIAILDASIKIFKATKDSTSLPPSFNDVATRIPLIQETLNITRDIFLTECQPAESFDAIWAVLHNCKSRAAALEKIFQAVIPCPGELRSARYLKALKSVPKADKVEKLMDGILKDLHILNGRHAANAATRTQLNRLMSDSEQRSNVEMRNTPKINATLSLQNMGSGSQYVYSGSGNQTIVNGNGTIISGTFNGSVSFGT